MGVKVVATNRKALFEFFLIEHYEAGIELRGSEIKSIRANHVSLSEAYVHVDAGEAFLVEAHIAPFETASYFNHDPKRTRKLLLHRSEIRELSIATKQKGMTIIPVKLYLKDGIAKLDIATAKGKKLYDKRHEIAKRDEQRDTLRELRQR
jgi:SsrA-binding protein